MVPQSSLEIDVWVGLKANLEPLENCEPRRGLWLDFDPSLIVSTRSTKSACIHVFRKNTLQRLGLRLVCTCLYKSAAVSRDSGSITYLFHTAIAPYRTTELVEVCNYLKVYDPFAIAIGKHLVASV